MRGLSPALGGTKGAVEGGDFAVQTVCVPVSGEKPAIGGILLWKDRKNWLRLDRGTGGEHEISFRGCLGNKDVVIGRGRLPFNTLRVFLRLERRSPPLRLRTSAGSVRGLSPALSGTKGRDEGSGCSAGVNHRIR